MKKILLLPLSLLLLFICLSCTRDVILKLDPAPPVLVLNASVTPEREVAAFLSKSWFLLDPSSESQKDSFKPSGRITSWQQHGRKRAESKMAYGTAWFYLSWYRLLPCHHNRITN